MLNKVILQGRLTRDTETRYSQGAEPMAIARYSLAVDRRFKKEGQPDADFINCVAFGKNGEFAEKFLKKGVQINIVGRLQTGSYTDKEGVKRYTTDVVVEEQHFTGKKEDNAPSKPQSNAPKPTNEGFVPIDDFSDDSLPF